MKHNEDKDILKLSWYELKQAYIDKRIKPSEVIKVYLEQIKKYDYLNIYISLCAESAMRDALIADKRYQDGTARVLEGFPVAIKDSFCTNGIRTTAGSDILKDFVPNYESFVTNCLWNDGAILLGKTNQDEFAMGSSNTYSYFGTTFNPWVGKHENPCCVGGSSGGSCASVAGYQALCALGTDTGGSVRQPAAFGGIVGIRPTYGTCSRRGMIAFSSAHDQAGVFGKDVYTVAACLDSIMKNDVLDATHAGVGVMNLAQIAEDVMQERQAIQDMKIGILKNLDCVTEPKIIDALNDVSKKLLDIGHTKNTEIELKCLDHAIATYYVLTPAEAASNMAMYDGTRYGVIGEGASYTEQCIDARRHFQEEVKRRILLGTYLLSHEAYDKYYIQALKVQEMMKEEFAEIFKQVDVIVTPTTPHTAFQLTEKREPHAMYYEDYYTVVVNMAGLCAISIPAGLDDNGMPIGIQLIAAPFREDLLIKIATWLEKQLKFKSLSFDQIISQDMVKKYLSDNANG